MSKSEYLKLVGRALADFVVLAVDDLEKENPPIEEWNDEMMLALYENTCDKRRV